MPVTRAREILQQFGTKFPVDVLGIAQRMGFLVISETNPPYGGMAEILDGRRIIRYRLSDPFRRQRFTIAHEIGHHELGHTRDGACCRDDDYTPGSDPKEREANAFAAELLVPSKYLQLVMEHAQYQSIQDIADRFDVSGAVIEYRLKDLGYISQYAG